MDAPVLHINLVNAIIALYLIAYQITICVDWSWLPMNEEDYRIPFKNEWSKAFRNR